MAQYINNSGKILLAMQIFCIVILSQIIIPGNNFSVNPAAPTTLDKVVLNLQLGIHPNSCVPTYETSHSVEPMICTGSCLDNYIISITYKEIPNNTDPICLSVLTPYGPSFNLGQLAAGTYNVVQRGSIFRFTVVDTASIPPGNSTVSGIVTENTGMLPVYIPIAGAKVYLSSNSFDIIQPPIYPPRPLPILDSTITDANGTFNFGTLKNGTYMVNVVASGYLPAYQLIFLGSDTTIQIQLTRGGIINPVVTQGLGLEISPLKLKGDNGILLKAFDGRLIDIQGFSISGEKIKRLHWSGKADKQLEIFSVSSGVYFFEIHILGRKIIQKLTVP